MIKFWKLTDSFFFRKKVVLSKNRNNYIWCRRCLLFDLLLISGCSTKSYFQISFLKSLIRYDDNILSNISVRCLSNFCIVFLQHRRDTLRCILKAGNLIQRLSHKGSWHQKLHWFKNIFLTDLSNDRVKKVTYYKSFL